MPRIETRITSVQIVPGFLARLTIPNPPGWEFSHLQQSPNTQEHPDARIKNTFHVPAAQHSQCSQQSPDFCQIGHSTEDAGFSLDVPFSPGLYPADAPGNPSRSTGRSKVNTPLMPEIEESSTIYSGLHTDTVAPNRSVPPFTSHVSLLSKVLLL